MERSRGDRSPPTIRALIAESLRRARGEVSYRQLGRLIHASPSHLCNVEAGREPMGPALAEALDRHFDLPMRFADLVTMARREAVPRYSDRAVEAEAKAIRVQCVASSLVPGLLQTEDYARAMFREGAPWDGQVEREDRLMVRMDRQRKVVGQVPLWCMIGEAALAHRVGGRAVMADQLAYLARTLPLVAVQVIPFAAGSHPLNGSTAHLYSMPDGRTVGYVESAWSGETITEPGDLIELERAVDTIRARALDPEQSADLIKSYEEKCRAA